MLWWKLSRNFCTIQKRATLITQINIKMADLSAITDNLKYVRERIVAASSQRSQDYQDICPTPRLVAVSKTKPKEVIIQAYKDGERHFGENYVQELAEKASNSEVLENCPEIKWHFIGHLQRSNVPKLMSVIDNIFMVETVDSEKLAKCLNDALKKRKVDKQLRVYVQVNTSGEESKSGVSPQGLNSLVKYIMDECSNLKVAGLMTIGNIDSNADDSNEDFKLLGSLREEVCKEFEMDPKDLELSMGMSNDFEKAIQMGSTNVRIGSTIFGARQYKTQ